MLDDLQPLNSQYGDAVIAATQEHANRMNEAVVPTPAFEDIREGLDYMDEQRALEEMRIAAERAMAADTDPRTQSYYMRTDTKTVVKDEREFNQCVAKKISLKVIPYSHAVQLLKEEEARKKSALKAKRKKKAAKQSRKRNRKC